MYISNHRYHNSVSESLAEGMGRGEGVQQYRSPSHSMAGDQLQSAPNQDQLQLLEQSGVIVPRERSVTLSTEGCFPGDH